MKLFERYVLSEVIPPLLGALAVVILLFVLAALEDVIAPLLAKGASPLLVARLLALNVPEALARALPLGLMFAALLGLSRLSGDSEIKGALASGVAVWNVMRPVLILAAGVAALSFLIGEGLSPRAYTERLKVQQQIVFENPRVAGLGEKGTGGDSLVLTDALGRAISVGSVGPGGELLDLRIVTTQGSLPPREVITARSGTLRPGSNLLELRDGQRITYQDARPVTVLTFTEGRLPVQDVQANFGGQNQATGEVALYLPLAELLRRTQGYRAQGLNVPGEFMALHRRFAEPLAALALGFFAVCLAIYAIRGGLNLGFTWAVLLAFAYYATWSTFRVMGERGGLAPVLAAYAPNLIAVLAGVGLLWRSARR